MTYPPQQFSQPSSGGSGGDTFNAADHKGHLLLVYPKNYQPEIQTKKGPSSAADVDVIVVDKPGPDGKPLSFINARLFGNLANSVRNDIGGQVLGRLDQITTGSGNTPWILNPFTDQDAAAAGPVHQAYQQGLFKPTENPMAAPPQQQWSGGAAAGPSPATPPPVPAPAATWQVPTQVAPAAPQQWQQPPAAPPQQQQWTPAPAAAPTPPPAAPPTPAAAPAVDPNLLAFLQARGVTNPIPDMGTAVAVGKSFPDFGANFPQYNQ